MCSSLAKFSSVTGQVFVKEKFSLKKTVKHTVHWILGPHLVYNFIPKKYATVPLEKSC